MSITRADILADVKKQFKRTDKNNEIYLGIQYICDDIALDFTDYDGLEDKINKALTQNIAYVDVSSELTDMWGKRIEKVCLIDSADYNNNVDLAEIDFKSDYLPFLEDPSNPQNEHIGDPLYYAFYKNKIYLKDVPNLTTYSIDIYFGKGHPEVSDTQNIEYPSEFKSCITQGVLWYCYKFVEKKDQFSMGHSELYMAMKNKLISKYNKQPNKSARIKYNDLG